MPPSQSLSLSDAVRVWAKIALLSFGGPAGQIALMHRELVETRRWIGEQRFLHALNYCMLLPGPEAQQLATYIGWLLHGVKGGLIAGGLFILPGFLSILGLSWLYVLLGHVPAVEGLFFGLKAAVLALVVHALIRLARRAIRGPVLWTAAGSAFLALTVFSVPFPVVVLGTALAGSFCARWLAAGGNSGAVDTETDTLLGQRLPAHTKPSLRRTFLLAGILLLAWVLPIAALLLAFGPDATFSRIALFFSKMAVVSFGGAYAVLTYVAQQTVDLYGWLSTGEMVDGLGLAETTPGPLIMVVQFVGFLGGYRDGGSLPPLLSGTLAALLTTWVTFVPCFLWIFVGAPFIETLRNSRVLSAALTTLTAAVVGVIATLALWFGGHVLFANPIPATIGPLTVPLPDPAATGLTVVAFLGLRWGTVPVLAACASLGIGLSLLPG